MLSINKRASTKNLALRARFLRRERGIRTPGPFTVNGFQDRRIKPLCHLSKKRQATYIAPLQPNYLCCLPTLEDLQGAGRIRLARTKINIFKHSSIRVFNFYIKYSKNRRIFFAEGLKILIFCLSLHSYKKINYYGKR